MAITTYATLQTAIADWLERGDATAVIPDFITLAEARMKRLLRTQDIIVRATASLTDEFSAVPSDFLQPRSMRLSASPYTAVQYLTPDQMLNAAQGPPTGSLTYYSVIGGEFQFSPIPTAAVSVELTYFAKFSALSASQTSNWILASHPDAYLNGALMEAGIYYRDDTMTATHQALFGSVIAEINESARRDEMGTLTPSASAFPV